MRTGLVVACVLALALSAACGGSDGETPFRVGVMESLTGPGESYGVVANQSKQMALDEINAAGGIDGRPLEFVVEDSMCSAQGAVAAYRKLTSVDGVKIILGTSCSGAMLGAAPLAEADGVVLFSGMASNADIANAGDYIFRTQISDIEVGQLTGDLLWADGVRRLVTIAEATDYAEGERRNTSVAQIRKALGGTGGGLRKRTHPTLSDFRSAAHQADSPKMPDALLPCPAQGPSFAAGSIMKQARELGYDGPIYSESVLHFARPLSSIAGDAATGLKSIVR